VPKSKAAAYNTAKRKSQPVMIFNQWHRLKKRLNVPLIVIYVLQHGKGVTARFEKNVDTIRTGVTGQVSTCFDVKL
jgi:hypothetical protein